MICREAQARALRSVTGISIRRARKVLDIAQPKPRQPAQARQLDFEERRISDAEAASGFAECRRILSR